MSDDIIDLGEYLRRRDAEEGGPGTFALWGAEGERSRFALPLWRAIYLVAGERGAVAREAHPGGPVTPLVVLDLAVDPPRTDFPPPEDPRRGDGAPPHLTTVAGGGVAVFLGADGEDRGWYVLLVGGEAAGRAPAPRDLEDILFLAGECAGLLFSRGFAAQFP